MPTVPLVSVTRGPNRHLVLLRAADGSVSVVSEMTQAEVDARKIDDSIIPPGVTKEQWENRQAVIAGGVPGYNNGRNGDLAHGEIWEAADRFSLGLMTDAGRPITVEFRKVDVNVSRLPALSIAPKTTFRAGLNINAIANGTLNTSAPVIVGTL